MSLYILDTDILTLYQHQHPLVSSRVDAQPKTDVALSAITVQEQFEGWRAALARARSHQEIATASVLLEQTVVAAVRRFPLALFTETAIQRYEQLLTLRLNVGRMDLRIAAIALENAAVVVTRNQRDFGRVPGLALQNWSV